MPSLELAAGSLRMTYPTRTGWSHGVAHHLNYFIQPRVCRALIDWLEIRETATHK
ncbi:MAG: hypothetical protein IMZ75_00375 [Actinobacteria bacterium]|nr:hypothetical protein [Actinomycetota bacterium]